MNMKSESLIFSHPPCKDDYLIDRGKQRKIKKSQSQEVSGTIGYSSVAHRYKILLQTNMFLL